MRIIKNPTFSSRFLFAETSELNWQDIILNQAQNLKIADFPTVRALAQAYKLAQNPSQLTILISSELGSIKEALDAAKMHSGLGTSVSDAWEKILSVANELPANADKETIFRASNAAPKPAPKPATKTAAEVQAPPASASPAPTTAPAGTITEQSVPKLATVIENFNKNLPKWVELFSLSSLNSSDPNISKMLEPAQPVIKFFQSNKNILEETSKMLTGTKFNALASFTKPEVLEKKLQALNDRVVKSLNKAKPTQGNPTKTPNQNPNDNTNQVPKLDKVDYANLERDKIESILSNSKTMLGEFAGKYNQDSEKDREVIYQFGIALGKKSFLQEVAGKTEAFRCQNPDAGLKAASDLLAKNKKVETLIFTTLKGSNEEYGYSLNSILSFATWVSFLVCVANSSSFSLGESLEKECSKYIQKLNLSCPEWTTIPELANLPLLGVEKVNTNQKGDIGAYQNGCRQGIARFLSDSRFEKNSQENLVKGQAQSKAITDKIMPEVFDVISTGNGGAAALIEFASIISYLLCINYSNAKTTNPKILKKIYTDEITKLGRSFPNWYEIPELYELNQHIQEGSAPDAQYGEIESAWMAGVNKGEKDFDTKFVKEPERYEFKGDSARAIAEAKAYFTKLSEVVTKHHSDSQLKFNKKNLTDFSSTGMLVYALIKSKASGKINVDFKAMMDSLFSVLDNSWKGWQDLVFFDLLRQFRMAGGYGSSMSPERARQLWVKVNEIAFARIEREVNSNPALANNEGLSKILQNRWMLSNPENLKGLFGPKKGFFGGQPKPLITQEKVSIAKEAIDASNYLKGANINAVAKYIVDRIASWCSSSYDYKKLEPYKVNDWAKKNYPNNGNQTSQQQQTNNENQNANPEKNQIEETEETRQDFEAVGVYAGDKFIGTISVALTFLASKANERSGYM